ncbi:HNH endonuclease signature motif containing protein [Nocardioides sp.]|uniref:HNH endonuclease n=1 Tax=Nocardioides sp. TaxID=35761 RepID=UPI00286C5B1A|nr:HNH endonuclease signature motif containing protein [Nocardioides sp.]
MFDEVLRSLLQQLMPLLPVLGPIAVMVVVLAVPMPGRGPRLLQSRDTWRGFKYAARRTVFERAGGRCEAAAFIAWGRCRAPASEADHVFPWSRRGPTVVSNGQALCRAHNRSKSNMRPPWWYVRCLERRRAAYFPAGASVRVLARMSEEDRAARAATPRRARR